MKSFADVEYENFQPPPVMAGRQRSKVIERPPHGIRIKKITFKAGMRMKTNKSRTK